MACHSHGVCQRNVQDLRKCEVHDSNNGLDLVHGLFARRQLCLHIDHRGVDVGMAQQRLRNRQCAILPIAGRNRVMRKGVAHPVRGGRQKIRALRTRDLRAFPKELLEQPVDARRAQSAVGIPFLQCLVGQDVHTSATKMAEVFHLGASLWSVSETYIY